MIKLLLFSLIGNAQAYEMPVTVRVGLTRACAGCHDTDGQENWIFDSVLNADQMVKGKYIKPGEPHNSLLVQLQKPSSPKIMPPRGPGLTPSEMAALERWIRDMDGKPKAPPARKPAGRTCYNAEETLQLIQSDVEKIHNSAVRYISLAELDLFPSELENTVAAINKTLNGLSWKKDLAVPERLPDAQGPVLKVDLNKYGINQKEWDIIAGRSPSRSTYQKYDNHEIISGALNTKTPIIQGNWLVPELMKPKNYAKLLGLPDNLADFEKKLKTYTGCAPHRNLTNGLVARSGITDGKSGVAFHNRIIERHECPDGSGYWVSYDYANSRGGNDIIQNPLTQKANGGEMIFRLPNGMLAFFLIQGNGEFLEKAPTDIVQDPARPSRDKAVENGVSCVRCHSAGFINKKDEVADAVQRRARSFGRDTLENVRKLYPDFASFTSLIERDNQDYQEKLKSIGVSGGADGRFTNDPITQVIQKFEKSRNRIKATCSISSDIDVSAPGGGLELDDLIRLFK